MAQKTIAEYKKMVCDRAWKRFVKERSFLDAFFTIVVFGFIVGAIVSVVSGKPKSMAEFFWSDTMITAIVTAAVFGFFYIVVYLIYLYKEPVILHNESAEKIELLENRLASEVANISVGKYERPKNYPYPNRAGILVLNNEHCDLTDVYVKLIAMKQIELHETEDWSYYDEERLISLHENNKEFEIKEESVIKAKDEKVFLLAKIQDNKDVVFLLKNKPYKAIYNYSIPHDGYITYKSRWEMEFDVRGKKEGKPFSERYFMSIKANRQVPIYENDIADKVSIEASEVIHVQQESGGS